MKRALNFVLCLGVFCMGESVHASAPSPMKLFNSFALLDEDAQDVVSSAPPPAQKFSKPGRRAKGKKASRVVGASSSAPAPRRLSPPDALDRAKLYVVQSVQKEGNLELLRKAISLTSQYADMGEKSPFNDVRAKALLALGWRLGRGSVKRTTIDGREYSSGTCYALVHTYAETFKKEGLLHEALLGLVESTPRGPVMLKEKQVPAHDICIQVYEGAPKNSGLAVRALKGILSCTPQESYLIKGSCLSIDNVLKLAYRVANKTQDREAAARCYWTMGQYIGEQHLPAYHYLARSDLFTLCAQSTSAPLPKARAFLFAAEARLCEKPEPGSLTLRTLRESVEEARGLAALHRDKGLEDSAYALLKRIGDLAKTDVPRVPAHSFMRYHDGMD